MTRDHSGTWEMESNDNFEGYMKALGKGGARGGKGGVGGKWGGGGKGRGRATLEGLWSGPPGSATVEFPRPVCKPCSSLLTSCVISGKSYSFSDAQIPHRQVGNNNK